MVSTKALVLLGSIIGVVGLAPVHAQSGRSGGSELTAQDRTEIQDLVTRYARALGSCAAEEYADLFAPGGGYFFSSIRGEVSTRERLILLVQSERHCNPTANPVNENPSPAGRADNPNANAAGRASTGPIVTAESSPEGARGTASLGNAGAYEDVYVKTPKGWRFKARSVITPQEAAVKLTAVDFAEIRRLAGNDRGQFDDLYVDTPNGKRFRSSGVALGLVPEGVKGTAYLRNDGGHYDDVYVRTANGWRFKSRTYVPPAETK
jgi:SnoaL-like protein